MNRPEYIAAVVIAACRRHESEMADDRTQSATAARIHAKIDHVEVFAEATIDEAMEAYEALARIYPGHGYSAAGAQSMWTLYASEPELALSIIADCRGSLARLAVGLMP